MTEQLTEHLTEQQIINKINQRQCFKAIIEGGAFTLKIEKYLPAMSAAIHDGSNFRTELEDNCLLESLDRYYEEDPYTGSFIAKQAITLIAHDSRYEYDLNRDTDECVYETAWGKEIWKAPLSEEMITKSKAKHAQFYRIVAAVVEALVEDFGQCIVYDNHSYNFKRHERKDLPVLNVGTSSVKSEQWRPIINSWLSALQGMNVDGIEVTAAENDIFYGKGRLAGFCHSRYDNVLVLATEAKKVFMNELTGEANEVVLPSLQQVYNATVAEHTQWYINEYHKS
ncbi:N-formylglutamate amidohydrolase [Colwellia psychrerythraea]|uniref:N-formylglutamate amidohydrolase n=1 Tax=Colwellia psychrerythraea TaxID=28229 RepID=A0A099KHG7_COLPS|nr:N-formylglutamate amidohydrolase [Colwellia psychrerythraea]KGJ89048.1 N-formylglutamate amidohydrolase [Colwellia psychrerythraea]